MLFSVCRIFSTSHVPAIRSSSIPSFSPGLSFFASSEILVISLLFPPECCNILPRVGTKRELLSRARARAATRLAGNDVIINGLVSISGRLQPRPRQPVLNRFIPRCKSLGLTSDLPSFLPLVSRTSRTY